jgi:putative transposase
MSRFRLLPTPAQQAVLRGHCAHARYVWNLAVEQHAHWRRGRKSAPGYVEQCRQLTAARAEHSWLAEGSQVVQQQALRDFAAATAAFYDPNNLARRPTWRRAGRNEGFRIVGKRGRQWDVRRVSRRVGQVRVPKAEHDPVRARNPGCPGPERPPEGRPESGHPGLWMGPAGPPPAGQGARAGRKD